MSTASHLNLIKSGLSTPVTVGSNENSPEHSLSNSENIENACTVTPRLLSNGGQKSLPARVGALRQQGVGPFAANVIGQKTTDKIILRNDYYRLSLKVLRDSSSNVEKITSSIVSTPRDNFEIQEGELTLGKAANDSLKKSDEVPMDDASSEYDEIFEETDSGLLNISHLNEQLDTSSLKNGDNLSRASVNFDDYKDDILSIEEGKLSYLSEDERYVKVAPPLLGSPLAQPGTPLDLTSVERRPKVGPIFDFEEADNAGDERKLLSILDYEFKKAGYSLNYEYSTADDNSKEMEAFDEFEKPSNPVSSMFYKLFNLGIYSKNHKYLERYPWFKIMYRADNPAKNTENETLSASNVGNFERNNTDMFPDGPNFTPKVSGDGSKHAVHYVASNKIDMIADTKA